MATAYDRDIVAWANEQAQLLRAKQWPLLDADRIAEEIEDVGRSEKRALASRLEVLLSHLLKWRFQPRLRGPSWRNTIKAQRDCIEDDLDDCPSLRPLLNDPVWSAKVYRKALARTYAETQLAELPKSCPWSIKQLMTADWLPD